MSITAAKLQAEVGADTKGFDRGMDHADSRVRGAGSKWAKALKVGAGVGMGLAAVAVVRGVTGAISAGVASLREQGIVVAQTNAVIRSTKGAANVSAAAIRDLSNATEDKTAIDDKAVQAGANMLLTFTNVRNEVGKGNDIFNQSVAVLADMSTAMGTDMKGGAIQLGKALNDPLKGITALTRVGVTFDAQQKKRIAQFVKEGKTAEAQKIILAELNKEFGGSGAAFAATDAGKAAKFQDAIEGIQQSLARALLPAITRVQGALTSFLSDPATMGQAEALGASIAGIFSEGNLKTAASVMTTAAGAIGTVIKLFGSLPPEVQALAVGALALKKITGIGPLDIVKGASGAINFIFQRGSTPANPLFVADVAGGIGKGLPGVAGAGAAAAAGTGLALATAVIAPAAVAVAAKLIQDQVDTQGAQLVNKAGSFAAQASDADLANSIKGIKGQLDNVALNPFNEKGKIVDTLNVLIAEQNRRTTARDRPAETGGRSLEDRDASRMAAIAGIMERAPGATAAAIQATFERNAARNADEARATTAAVKMAGNDTVTAIHALPSGLKNALGGLLFTGSAPGRAKDDLVVPTPRRPARNATGGPDDRGSTVRIVVPGVASYQQTLTKAVRWGPMVPNQPRRSQTV